jgi:Saxitoxin biosynthesis operon protein SxtJ
MPTPFTSRRELRQFGLTLGLLLASLFGLVFPWLAGRSFPFWPWVVASLLAGLALFGTGFLAPIFWAWMKVVGVLNWISTRAVLGLAFYVVVVPMGSLMRLFNNDPLRRDWSDEAASYRVPTEVPPKDHMERPF